MRDLYRMNSNADEKRQFNKLKHDLENWREMILIINSILKWDKQFYPGIIFGVVSFTYLFLWYLDLSLLTLFSLFLLCLTISDYLYPIISKFIFKTDNWSGVQEKMFEGVCHEIISAKLKITQQYDCIFVAKEEKSIRYVLTISVLLIVLAWIGSVVDNMLLSYFASLIICMYPGLLKHGFVEKIKHHVMGLLSSQINKIKSKSTVKSE